ncbi:low molecular weight phosphatase family protein [Kitasatospora sp. KL5]|uniref:arsenate reductase/protein-tyrosine-phosphatase family protein n=1 Tax=Kitasatospora sp. KL5 TaxID=3425125 RepID=UPI003D6DCD41
MTRFEVLFVCTGNLYRSPIGERLFAAHTGPSDGGVRVGSAGTLARPGLPVPPSTAAVLEELGGTADAFATRRLTAGLVASADLVLGLAREHRDAAVRLHPVALRRCFALEEFVRLADAAGPEEPEGGPRAVVARAAALRGRTPPVAEGADDIADPDGRPVEELRTCAARIDRAVRRAAAALMIRQGLPLSD